MKKISLLIFVLTMSLGFQAKAQTDANCSIMLQQRQPLADNTLAYFNLQGMNLARYDWKNKQLNCDINNFNNNYKKERLFKILGYVGMLVGASVVAVTPVVTVTDGSAAATVVPGVIFLGGGATAYVFGARAKKKKNRYYQNILMEYSKNPWN